MQISSAFLNLNKKQLSLLILVVLLLLAIPVGVYLSQNSQIFKPKATGEDGGWARAFELKEEDGTTPIQCDYSKNPPECTTSTLNIKIKVDPNNLNQLQQ